ncbi:hypothetical protein [Kitasatospora sp. NPDC127116]|uniref:hypothetical protein n=1 Tax=Kitasatospora sp. NPDC127116 TaxID=3345367 RepID=UPI00363C44C2
MTTQPARDLLLAELLHGEDPTAPEYADARARLDGLITDHRAEVIAQFSQTDARDVLDRHRGETLRNAAARVLALPTANAGRHIAATRAQIVTAVQDARTTPSGDPIEDPIVANWDRMVIHPTDPAEPTIVCCRTDDGTPVALFLDPEHREALGLQLVDPDGS